MPSDLNNYINCYKCGECVCLDVCNAIMPLLKFEMNTDHILDDIGVFYLEKSTIPAGFCKYRL